MDVALPDDIIDVILAFAADSPRSACHVARVSREWREKTCGVANNALWKEFALKRWVIVDRIQPVDSWFDWYMMRVRKLAKSGQIADQSAIQILECAQWRFKCPLSLGDLEDTGTHIRFCNQCSKNVVICNTPDELLANARLGNCVAYDPTWEGSDFSEMGDMPLSDES